MIPHKLTIEGVYSYRTRQIIDFQTLSEAGIFGVFGAVGSGKSAVLESMTYALYGQIERLNDKEQRGYNIMNLQSSSLFIDFEFSHKKEDYRFTVSAKRNKKDFSKIQSPERSGYIKKSGKWVPLPDEGMRGGISAESVMGLSYEHFRKTVIIPQGKFQEFIMLPPAQRTAMIETLFGLERFNLSSRTNILLARSREECSFLEGKLDDLQSLTGENLETLETELSLLEKAIALKSKDRMIQSDRLKKLEEILQIKQEQARIEVELQKLESRKEEIRKREEDLNRFRRLDRIFSQDLKSKEELIRQKTEIFQQKEELESRISSAEIEMKKQEAYWLRLEGDQENYADLSRNRDSLEAAEEIKNKRKLLEKTAGQLKELENHLIILEKDHQKKIKRLEEQDRMITALESQLEEAEELNALEDWYGRSKRLNEKLTELNESIRELQEDSAEYRNTLREEFKDWENLPGCPVDTIRKDLMYRIQKEAEELDHRLTQMEEQNRTKDQTRLLSDLAEALEDGRPCPLCGALHHPDVISAGKEFSYTEEETALKASKKKHQSRKERVQEILTRLEYLESAEIKTTALLKEHLQDREGLDSQFIWNSFDPVNNEKFTVALTAIQIKKNDLKTLRETRLVLDRQMREAGISFHKGENETVQVQGELKNWKQQLEALEKRVLPEHKETLPPGLLEGLRQRLGDLDRDYQRLKGARIGEEEVLQTLRNEERSLELILQNNRKEQSGLDQQIAQKLQAEQPLELELIREILSRPPDEEKERSILENFHTNLKLLLEGQDKVRKLLSQKEEIPGEPLEIKRRLEELELEIQEDLRRIGALKSQKQDLKAKLDQKKTLSENLKKQRIRQENLKELAALFKGRKFVEYIAEVYLQELCQLANIRFSPLTNRSLELVFQENQILVRDFLNEGRLRHVKTLSGGQTFQAALCLALALAEQTGRGKGSFFFLDEGFGSLDRASLETVMASLRQLSREGRIIGLISHVEDLQQDLDVWLKVIRDDEKGSRIQSSWLGSED